MRPNRKTARPGGKAVVQSVKHLRLRKVANPSPSAKDASQRRLNGATVVAINCTVSHFSRHARPISVSII